MKRSIFIILTFIIITASYSQSCLPDGITFTTQAHIDSFPINFPGCAEIEGFVKIAPGASGLIFNLDSLSVLQSIGGYLDIQDGGYYTSLVGLNNITTVGGYLRITGNNYLSDLTGLGSLISVGGDMIIGDHVGFGFGNDDLINLSGLESLTTIGGALKVQYNSNLQTLDGLQNLNNTGSVWITNNVRLHSLMGINNINDSLISELTIRNNYSLTNCHIESVCNYLSSPSGIINIIDNGVGCADVIEVADSCNIDLECLPYGNYWLTSQSDIDDFNENFPDCNALEGRLRISGDDISSLDSLYQITSISGHLILEENPILTSLNGLNNILSIGGELGLVRNNSLSDFIGLENLSTIGEDFVFYSNSNLINVDGLVNLNSINGKLFIKSHDKLENLDGLINVSSIGGDIRIWWNSVLSSLSGLDSIDANSIEHLSLGENPCLSHCAIQSICEYLGLPNGTSHIVNNLEGCNSREEIEAICDPISVGDNPQIAEISFYPNPATDQLTITTTGDQLIQQFSIYNQYGQQILSMRQPSNSINVSELTPGLYIVEFVYGSANIRKKIIIN